MTSSARQTNSQIAELEAVAEDSTTFQTSVDVFKEDGNEVTLILELDYISIKGYHHAAGSFKIHQNNTLLGPRQNAAYYPNRADSYTFTEILNTLAGRFPKGKLNIASVKVRAKNCPLKGKELKELATKAWCEARGVALPSDNELRNQRKEAKKRTESKAEELVKRLKTKTGIKKFNEMHANNELVGTLKQRDLTGFNLTDAHFYNLDLSGSDFTGARIVNSNSKYGMFNKACFQNSKIKDCQFQGAKLKEANFNNAVITSTDFSYCDLRNANFEKTKLKNLDFSGTDLRGAKLAEASINSDVLFDQTKFDEETTFPAGFDTAPCQWAGNPAPDRTEEILKEIKPDKSLDFAAFLEKLDSSVDSSRLKKSMTMLQKDSFQLYSNVTDDHVVGVVKSQTDPDLVYSCRLTKDGDFACCTQNLFSCGGLRGKLCKHLLLLVVALSKAEEIDASLADVWVRRSAMKKPKLDKEIMSEAFLNYKGAEAGEVDWRPTETIPEDFYAF